MLIATLVCFLFVCCNFGTVFWLPQIVKSLGVVSNLQVGLLTAIPYLLGGAATILWGRHSRPGRETGSGTWSPVLCWRRRATPRRLSPPARRWPSAGYVSLRSVFGACSASSGHTRATLLGGAAGCRWDSRSSTA